MRKSDSLGLSSPRRSLAGILAAVSMAAAVATAQPEPPPPPRNSALLPPDFTARVSSHIESVVARSPRPVSSEGERQTIAYVRDQFQQMGLPTAVEEFEFGSYQIDDMQLRVGELTFRPVFVGVNPYAGVLRFEGSATLIDPREMSSAALSNIEDHYVISAASADYFRLVVRKPKLLVFLAEPDFDRLKAAPARRFALTVTGHPSRHKSANVSAVAGSSDAQREIVVSAHLDAHRNSPGASDNGSGLGVLIELARYFQSIEGSLRSRVKFVAFGGEEVGLLGSRVYVEKHAGELPRCLFHLNIDDLGGSRCPVVETQGGVAGIPPRPSLNLLPTELMDKAWEGFHGEWRLVDPQLLQIFQASNRPPWLTALFDRGARDLGVKLIPSGSLGSDQMAFTQAGVPATGIGCTSGLSHSPADLSLNVNKENLRTVGQLVACVVATAATVSPDQAATPAARIAQTVAAISAGADSAQRRSAILKRLDDLKLKYHLEQFCSGSACGINVVVDPDRPGARAVMLGAHYDRAPQGQGAVDDGAGVAAVLELLAEFKARPLSNLALAAAFFDLEEAGMLGSKAYISARQLRQDLPALFLNFDVFAYGDTLFLASDAKSSALVGAIREAANQQGVALTVEDHAPPGDDRTFREAGVETLGLALVRQVELESIHKVIRGEEVTARPSLLNIVHTAEDTPGKVSGVEVAGALLVVEATIRTIDTAR